MIDISSPAAVDKIDGRTDLLMPNTFFSPQVAFPNNIDNQRTPVKMDSDMYPLSANVTKKNPELNTSEKEQVQRKVDEMVIYLLFRLIIKLNNKQEKFLNEKKNKKILKVFWFISKIINFEFEYR